MNAFRRAAAALVSAGLLCMTAWSGFVAPAHAAITDVVVNEADSQDASGGRDWIELYNKGTAPVDISGLVVKDSDDTNAYTIPAGTTIAAGGYLTIDIDAVPGGFGLGKNDSARLFAADGTTLLSEISWGPHAVNTWGLCPNGTGSVTDTAAPTKGTANQCTKPEGKIVINEIDSQPADWVELKNVGDAPIDLTGYVLTDNSPNDATHRYTFPAGTIVQPNEYLTIDTAFGLGGADSVILHLPDGTTVVDSHSWTAHSPTTLGRCADGVGAFTDTAAPTKGAANQCPLPAVVVNEIKSTGDGPDAIELYNAGTTPVDLTGFIVKDNDDTRNAPIPAGKVIQPGGYLVLTEGDGFTFGLGNGDAARLFMPDGTTLVDGHTYSAHGVPSWGRCPDATGEFVQQTTLTLGAANDCGAPVPSPTPTPSPTTELLPWPGSQEPTISDLTFLEDSSGLDFQFVDGQGVLWAIDNGTGRLWKLDVAADGTLTKADGWADGKRVRFQADASNPDAKGPDSEGVTVADNGMVYVAVERNNADKSVNLNKVLMVDPNGAGPDLVAVQEWDLTNTLPAVTANTGIEAVQYVPDSALAGKLWDANAGAPYDPARYAGHGDGLFFVAVEDNGTVYAFALNADGSHKLVSQFTPGLGGVMALDYDPVLGVLWAMCDDGCENSGAQVTLNGTATPDVKLIAKPTGLPVHNFEGFATSTQDMCVAGERPVWWFEDGVAAGMLRAGTLPCEVVTPTPEPSASSTPSETSTPAPSASESEEPTPTTMPKTGADDLSALLGAWLVAITAATLLTRRR